MKIVDLNLATLDRLASLMRPEHYVGFLLGLAGLALFEEPESDWETVRKLMDTRNEFIARQRDADEPTGLPVAPVYWTDINPEPHDDEEEVIALEPTGCAFLLCSSVEPHARWVVKHYVDDDTITVYKTQFEAKDAIEARRVEYQEEFAKAVEKVRRHYRDGDIDAAEHAMQDFEFSISDVEDGSGYVTVEGERIKIGGGDEPASGLLAEARAECIADVKKALANRKPLTAASRASRYGLTFSWDPEDAFTAIIDEERFNCFTLNVCDPARRREVGEFHPGLAVERIEPIDAPTVTTDVIPAGAILSRGAAIESIKAHLLAGDQQGAAKIAVANSIPLSVRSDGSYAHVDHVRLDIPRIVPRHFQGDEPPAEFKGPEKIGRDAAQPSPEPVTIVAVDLCGNTGVTLRLSDGTTKSYKLTDGPAVIKSVWIDAGKDENPKAHPTAEGRGVITERVKAHLRAGECGKAEDLARDSGIWFAWTPVPFEVNLGGEIFNFSGTPHGL